MRPLRDDESDHAWNRTAKDYPTHRLVHELFEDHVRERPDAMAVSCGGAGLTYRQLDERAEALASHLRHGYGLEPGGLVCMVLDRSEHVLVAMLGVLKAGGAYVPVEPDSPARRIELILGETRSRVVLTDDANSARLADIVGAAGLGVGVLSIPHGVPTGPPAADPGPDRGERPGSDSLAYVIYTSGTTGRPKGVMVEHRSVVNYVCNVQERLGLSADDTCGYSTNTSFDLTVTTTLACLALGGRVAVHPGAADDVGSYRRFLVEHGVTFIKLTPSYFGLVADSLHETSVRTVVLGGEKLTRTVLDRIRTRVGQELTVHDEYGPTEATVGACAAVVHPQPADHTPNIGTMYGNYRSHVLDADLRPVPVGDVGELFLGGLGLARGYLGRPELTAERFLRDPFQAERERSRSGGTSPTPEARVYRTGDLVRRLPGGELEYLGRNDDQVKIRGFRVEVGEVEHAVEGYGDVEGAVVVARVVGADEEVRGLVAYVVAGDFGCSEEALAEHLRESLPDYMVPSTYVFLDELPLKSNGKIDRAALPKPESSPADEYVAPRTELEGTVAEIWEELLGRDGRPIGITDDFFSLGGDSIIAIQLLGRIRGRFGVHFPVHELLSRATVEQFCEFLGGQLDGQQPQPVGQEGDGGDPSATEAPLLPVQRWFFDGDFTRPNHWNQAFLIATPPLDTDRLRECVRELGNRHGAFRFRYRRTATGETVQFHAGDHRPTELVTASAADAGDLQDLFTAWQSDFDLEHGPVYRVGYLDGLADGSARVFIACHHLAVDAVSWRVLTEDLEALYHGWTLPAVGSGFGQWPASVERYPSLHPDEHDYWQDVQEEFAQADDSGLAGLVRSDDTRTVSGLSLDRDTTRRLLECHRAYNTQINDVLLAGFAHALTDLTGASVNHIVLEGHGREDIDPRLDVGRTVGWFTTMFPVRLRTGPDLLATLRETKETLRGIPSKGIGYGALYGYRSDRMPRINFNYLGRLDSGETTADGGRWVLTREPAGEAVDPVNRDDNIMTINGWIADGRLTFTIANKLGQEIGDRLTQCYQRALAELIRELSDAPRTYLTPSDVDLVVSTEYLDELQASREIEAVYLANSLQQGFIYQAVAHGRDDDAYTVQMWWRYATRIDADALHEAWTRAQRTFPALRLRFGWGEELVQIIDGEAAVDWRFVDLTAESPAQQEVSMRRLREADRAEPYDLGSGALFRVYLVSHGPAEFLCLFSHHHSILDGWSNTVLLNRVHETYEAIVSGLPTDTVPDRSYPSGQQYLQEHRDDHSEFWRDALAAFDERIDLQGLLSAEARANGLRVESTRRVEEMRELDLTLSGEQYDALRRSARDAGVTLNALFLYVWNKTLACYTGADRTITGVVLSGRGIPVNDIDQSVGLFINTLPLIVDHGTGHGADHETVLDGLREVQARINELHARATVNLGELHEGADRLFDTLFIYENWPRISADGWQTRLAVHMAGESEKLDYPLSVVVSETPDTIRLRLVYAAELFDGRLMSGMLDLQRHLLGEVAANRERRWRDTPLLSKDQFRELDAALNPPAEPLPRERTFLERFEEQVRRHPERIAVSHEGAALTYGALDEEANRLADVLGGAHGVQHEEPVVLLLDKGLDLMVSVLAVLKAGAAYVLVDPHNPKSRVGYILEDTGARLVITTSGHRERLEESGHAAVLCLDDRGLRDALAAASTAAPGVAVPGDALMYVLYTSGTTGVPKGVMVEHRAFGLVLAGMRARYFADREALSTYSMTSHVFDIFGLEYGLPLWTGGSVELASEIPANLDCGAFDFIQMTSSVCELMLDRLEDVPSDLLLLVGGERLPRELLHRVLSRSIDLANVYGPTETTIWSTSRLYRHADAVDDSVVSIGTPLSGESVHVLDGALRPLPMGAVGELCVGGDGHARGYLNKDELTAERFVSIPLGQTRPTRVYRTGDLVRLLPSGALEFIGRNDAQVKISGHRIELGEIDGALASHRAAQQSVVLVVELGAPTLIGYYVADEEIPPGELDEHLRSSLPGYMVPARCIRLDTLPLTVNGKLDRAALPQPSSVDNRVHVLPRSSTEAELCTLMAGLLGLDPVDVGIDDDFFQLGGTSLLSIKLVSAAERELGIAVSVGHLLANRTVRAFVDNLDGAARGRVTIPVASFASVEDQKLSFAQERLWFIERFENGTSAYNLPLVLEVADGADTDALLAAARGVVARHDVLRTVLRQTQDGTAYQEVLPADVPLPIEVLRTPDREATNADIRRELDRSFDLADEGPLRVRLYETPSVGCRLVFIVHHVAFDGWSADVLLADLLTAYDLAVRADPGTDPFVGLPEPQLRYRDVAVWQRDHLSGRRLERLQDFWQRELDGYEHLDLVPDHPRPDSLDYRGADLRFEVGAEVSGQLRQLAQELRVSLFSLLLSAHFLTLRCFSNQDDIVVGTPVANRDHAQLADLVGFFVNTLPIRTHVDVEDRVTDYVRKIASRVLDTLRHQELPFEQLLGILDVERDVSQHPIFQVTFGVQSFGALAHDADGPARPVLSTAPETQELYTAARFDLSTFVDDSCESLQIEVNYATSLFERDTVNSFGRTYLTLLHQFASLAGSEPRQRNAAIRDLAYLDEDRHREMVERWSAPRRRFASETLLHQSVEKHARRSPDRVALVREELRLTYGELNAEANRLAHHLLAGDRVEPGSAVLLCLDRGEDVVVSILASLKAGGGYLPVDPAYPDDRIGFMLTDAGVRTVVTHSRHVERFTGILARAAADGEITEPEAVDVIAVDDPGARELLDAMPDTNPVTEVAPGDLAYVLYTSGTTGRPKGVPQTHANVGRLFTALENVYDIREDDVWTLFHNYVFDFTVWEMWGAFLYGGRLVVPTFEQTRDPELYYALCRTERVTMLCQTPTAFYQFVNVALGKDDGDRVDDLRYVFFGGEALNVSLLTEWFERYSHDRPLLAMGYGTTETTVFTCYKLYDETDEGSTDIGSLIPDVAGYVLDAQQRLLPRGAVGELHIGGAGLASELLNRPELTARKFVANPFATGSDQEWNGRLYKSGDLVRWAPDRTLRFVGRNDLQVKIRGHRIELGEIEAVLADAPGVLQSAVVVRRTDDGGQAHLVGYYVAEGGGGPEPLFGRLEAKLPTYMIPAALVRVDELPRKISGKLDVDALPHPQLSLDRVPVGPRDAREALARVVLAEVLGADPETISVHDDFFQFGGDSILSIKLASRLSAELGADVSIGSVFRHRSVAGLVDGLGAASRRSAALPPIAASAETAQVASFAQERFWFIDHYESGNDGYNIHLCYEVLPGVDADVLERCLREVHRRHEVLRTVIRLESDGRLYQVVLDPETSPLDVRHTTATGEGDLAARFGTEGRHEFDLAHEAPLRVTFYRQEAAEGSPSRTFVGILIHHIAFDGWSADVLLEELNRLYSAAELPEPRIQYKDYAAWEREHVGGARLARLLEYWKGRLHGRRAVELPVDRVRPSKIDYSGGRVAFELAPETSAAARRLARENGVGLFSVLLSAYLLMLRAYTGRSDLLVGIPVANRMHVQTHELIGCFTNTLALDFDIDGDDDVETLIKKVGARVVEAQLYQELPFERLVAELDLTVDPARHPLFQIWFDVNSFAETDADRSAEHEPVPTALLRTHTLAGRTPDDPPAISSNLEFGLVVNDGGESLDVTITYATALFDHGTVEGFAATYRSILTQFARTK